MGNADRVFRLILALAVPILYFTGNLSGTWAIILFSLAAIFFLTSLAGFCPLYRLIGVNTCGVNSKDTSK